MKTTRREIVAVAESALEDCYLSASAASGEPPSRMLIITGFLRSVLSVQAAASAPTTPIKMGCGEGDRKRFHRQEHAAAYRVPHG